MFCAILPRLGAPGATDFSLRGGYNARMKIIYADSVFLLNLTADYFLCLVSARACGLILKRGRYLAAAAIGAGIVGAALLGEGREADVTRLDGAVQLYGVQLGIVAEGTLGNRRSPLLAVV